MNFLLVDDDAVDREMVKRSLFGFSQELQVLEASSVDDALDQCAQEKFDVILLDYRMPKKNGVDFILALGVGERARKNVVVMMSNSEDENLALECIDAGAQDFILKKEINSSRLRRVIVQAKKRFDLENKLRESYFQVKYLAERDQLTSLANRYLFEESLKLAIANVQRSNKYLSLLLFDIDNFKFINDTLGHSVGDLLLVNVCQRVNEHLRGDELFARLGGDEFVILVKEDKDLHGARKIADRIHMALGEPFFLNDKEVWVTVSIGITVCKKENALASEELMKQADIAMYRSKKEGKGNTRFFEKGLQKEVENRISMESGLMMGLKREEFFLLYQPIVNAKDGNLVRCEVLLRWRRRGIIITPQDFLTIAEDSRKICIIGRWVISRAVEQVFVWKQQFTVDVNIAINLSGVQLTDPNLPEYIVDCCQRFGVSPSCIEFELSETALLEVNQLAIHTLETLSSLGCSIALDDFGTGYSSITYLRNFPISTLKIDRSIIPSSQHNEKDKALFSGLLKMVNTMGLHSVAEGVETIDMVNYCVQQGVECLQGHYFSKPLTIMEFNQQYLAGLDSNLQYSKH
ncbi:GGDEF domain-containing response regulator [Marinibactrum halimedae]|uniref:GGDEF domain-containing response regulator n=1 Tax=Marinibactrum halimedae TaxID=1444977 RepID=A0AA37TD16_9GAMM|nr:GGDEF domain-containing response regulator [Marinibactrum halimedae]MCD9459795.1 EAL domain-containing protein [Marinibactrum halimedae]GLS27012.1 GGDEF domain-containing response regulator [Marinibactrum halimedae]